MSLRNTASEPPRFAEPARAIHQNQSAYTSYHKGSHKPFSDLKCEIVVFLTLKNDRHCYFFIVFEAEIENCYWVST